MTRKPMSELLSAEQTIIALIYMSKVAREDMHEFKMRLAKTASTLSLKIVLILLGIGVVLI
jgi:hypothetical protein